ncbi:hypothetical protein [Alkalihalobacterium elongatum]|uniref:hypothetical protein n=1 Tax=Alkalihalobacterium elongatum TaxID=2675466 RepID=UPI001C1F77C2|nr:hypothetical protein [Alkalihalobacterium elongatum]
MSRSHLRLEKGCFLGKEVLKNRLQAIVNQIIDEYYSIDKNERSSYHVLLLIAEHWKKINIEEFHSTTDYYTVLAKTTDLLLKGFAYNEGACCCKIINDQPVIISQMSKSNGIRATIFVIETDVQEAMLMCNQVKSYLEKMSTTNHLYVSICSLIDGNVYKLYDRK